MARGLPHVGMCKNKRGPLKLVCGGILKYSRKANNTICDSCGDIKPYKGMVTPRR